MSELSAPSPLRPHHMAWLALIAIATVAGCVWLALHPQGFLVFFVDQRLYFLELSKEFPFQAMLVYVVFYFLYVSIGIPASFFITILGGFLFDWRLAILLSISAATLGGSCLVVIVRHGFRNLARQWIGPRFHRLSEGFNRDAVSYLLFMRLMPVFPFWVVNLVVAVMNVPLRIFIPATFVGMAPAASAAALIGSGLDAALVRPTEQLLACRAGGQLPCDVVIRWLDLAQPSFLTASIIMGSLSILPPLWRYGARFFAARRQNGPQK